MKPSQSDEGAQTNDQPAGGKGGSDSRKWVDYSHNKIFVKKRPNSGYNILRQALSRDKRASFSLKYEGKWTDYSQHFALQTSPPSSPSPSTPTSPSSSLSSSVSSTPPSSPQDVGSPSDSDNDNNRVLLYAPHIPQTYSQTLQISHNHQTVQHTIYHTINDSNNDEDEEGMPLMSFLTHYSSNSGDYQHISPYYTSPMPNSADSLFFDMQSYSLAENVYYN